MNNISAENENRLFDLYANKIELLNDVLTMTKNIKFDGLDSAEQYITLMDNREELFTTAKELDKKIGALSDEIMHYSPSKEFNRRVSKYKSDIKELAEKIIELDNKVSESVNIIFSELRDQIKGFKQYQKFSGVYRPSTFSEGTQFDKSN